MSSLPFNQQDALKAVDVLTQRADLYFDLAQRAHDLDVETYLYQEQVRLSSLAQQAWKAYLSLVIA